MRRIKLAKNQLKRIGIAKIVCDVGNPYRKLKCGVKFIPEVHLGLLWAMHSQKLPKVVLKRGPVDNGHVR